MKLDAYRKTLEEMACAYACMRGWTWKAIRGTAEEQEWMGGIPIPHWREMVDRWERDLLCETSLQNAAELPPCFIPVEVDNFGDAVGRFVALMEETDGAELEEKRRGFAEECWAGEWVLRNEKKATWQLEIAWLDCEARVADAEARAAEAEAEKYREQGKTEAEAKARKRAEKKRDEEAKARREAEIALAKQEANKAKAKGTRGKNIPGDVKETVLEFVERECGGDVRGEGWKEAFDRFAESPYYTAKNRQYVGSWPAMKRIAEAARLEKKRREIGARRQKK